MSEARALMTQLLRYVGGRKEVEQYLRHYGSVESQKFAVIELGPEVLHAGSDTLATSLAFLQQVGLLPIVVHGASPRIDAELSAAGFAEPFEALPEALAVVRRVMQEDNLTLVEALERQGAKARPIAAGVFEAEAREASWEGDTTGVDPTAITAALRAGQIPVLAALGSTPSGQSLYLREDDAAHALARKLEPHKLIVLRSAGGWVDVDGRPISAINLSEDYQRVLDSGALSTADQARLKVIDALLDELPDTSSVSITSPDHLARELFTHRGAGTLIQDGERVLCFERFRELDRKRLRELLETCFGRKLTPRYFEEKSFYRVYVSEEYRATAILTHEGGVPYLDKFAVTTKAQGEGLGGSVWERMRAENPTLFWRSQSQNEVNGWYFQQADGCFKTPQWTVFWYGMRDFDEIRRCIETALSLPATLRQHARADV